MIETERLILRAPTTEDCDALAAINGDPRVGDWLGGTQTREQSDAMVVRIQKQFAEHGFGYWVMARKADGAVLGLAGLLLMGADMPPAPATEIGWRVAADAWGQGYATEAARAALAWGFANVAPDEIIAITADSNLRSQAVMRKIGMTPEPWRDFDHPKLAGDHSLRRHVLFSAKRSA